MVCDISLRKCHNREYHKPIIFQNGMLKWKACARVKFRIKCRVNHITPCTGLYYCCSSTSSTTIVYHAHHGSLPQGASRLAHAASWSCAAAGEALRPRATPLKASVTWTGAAPPFHCTPHPSPRSFRIGIRCGRQKSCCKIVVCGSNVMMRCGRQ